MKTTRLNGELVPLTRLSALRIVLQKNNAVRHPNAYPQHRSRLNRLGIAAMGILRRQLLKLGV